MNNLDLSQKKVIKGDEHKYVHHESLVNQIFPVIESKYENMQSPNIKGNKIRSKSEMKQGYPKTNFKKDNVTMNNLDYNSTVLLKNDALTA